MSIAFWVKPLGVIAILCANFELLLGTKVDNSRLL